MRHPLVAAALCAVIAWLGPPSRAQLPATPPSSPEIQELRETLLDQLKRLDALEATGAAVDPEEIAALKAILAQTNARISALEAGQAAAASGAELAPPLPNPLPAEVSTSTPTQASDDGKNKEAHAGDLWGQPYMPTFYGILKPRFGVSSQGQAEVGQSTSRLGLDFHYDFDERFAVFGRLELGINMTKQNTVFVYPAHGPPQGQGKDAIYTRLGYGGVSTPWGSVSVGKMNSTYYDIAGWTDQFYSFGADASGAFGVADGGVAGTGRASTAVQYRLDKGWFHLGFQSQHRNSESNDAKWYDTVGGSLRFDIGPYWTVGAAYQEVRDGVPAPEGIEAKDGDKAFIAGVKFQRGHWYLAADYSDTRQNQKDDRGVWFDAHGFEFAALYTFNRRWALEAGYNVLEPSAPYEGGFRTKYGVLTVVYTPHKNLAFSGEFRFDSSTHAGGVRWFPQSVLVLGLDFGW